LRRKGGEHARYSDQSTPPEERFGGERQEGEFREVLGMRALQRRLDKRVADSGSAKCRNDGDRTQQRGHAATLDRGTTNQFSVIHRDKETCEMRASAFQWQAALQQNPSMCGQSDSRAGRS
jgi:hypothetical protein